MLKFILILLISLNFLSSQELEDSKEEQKDSEKKETKHKIILKGQLGIYGKYDIPESSTNRKTDEIENSINILSGSRGQLYTRSTSPTRSITPAAGIEYRFLNKFRFLYDYRSFDSSNSSFSRQSKDNSSLYLGRNSIRFNGNYEFSEKIQKFGFAYFQPIGKYFSLGAMLRRYSIEQESRINRKPANESGILGILFPGFPFFIDQQEENRASYKGLVPGLGFEVFLGKSFEVRFSHEVVNLKGEGSTNLLLRSFFSTGYVRDHSDYTYKGQIQNIDFGFRLPNLDFLTIRLGLTDEKLKRKTTSYNYGTIINTFGSIDTSSVRDSILRNILYSSNLVADVRFTNLFMQFEFGKAF
jgi:hypothetical protein